MAQRKKDNSTTIFWGGFLLGIFYTYSGLMGISTGFILGWIATRYYGLFFENTGPNSTASILVYIRDTLQKITPKKSILAIGNYFATLYH
jgi:hypothetical protein